MPRYFLLVLFLTGPLLGQPLPNTQPLTRKGDLSAEMVAGIDAYLTRVRSAHTVKPDTPDRLREKLRTILGVVDTRLPASDLHLVATVNSPALVAQTERYKVLAVRWPVLPGVEGEGLLLEPTGKVAAQVVALPDADQTPEQLVGLAPGVAPEAQFARILAEAGCRVVVPVLINRDDKHSGNAALNRWTNQPHREFIYRMAYEMGRHILGYEVQKVLAVVDSFTREKEAPPVGVIGYAEGGLLAAYSSALDPRIRTTLISGALYAKDQPVWEQPIYRNVWAIERDFDRAGLLALCQQVIVEESPAPAVAGPPTPRPGRAGAAPGILRTPEGTTITAQTREGNLARFLKGLGVSDLGKPGDLTLLKDLRKDFAPEARQERQFHQLVAFTQKIMRDSEAVRARTFWRTLDLSSPEAFARSTTSHRERLHEVIGKLPPPTMPLNPQTRPVYDEPRWQGYEVTLDVYPDVYAYGILLLPKDLKPGEKRPVVVCQHGLEGTPRSCIDPEPRPIYARFAARLADLGYIVYCPQNPYIGRDKFRVLQRKANPLGLSLFSFIVRQHERTLDWLETLPNVDAKQIAFYGLSYGGKTAMRVPALVPRYCLSICAGDFNEWIWKNVSYDFPGSYVFTLEYEMPEFDLGHTFNYAEMAALIAPRPFMVERGHDDGVGIDEWVAYEYAKVRRLYSRLKMPERTTLEFFSGGHEIKLQGTLEFLKQFVPLAR